MRLALIFVAASAVLSAQGEEGFSTDRPGFTAGVLPQRVIQIEGGVAFLSGLDEGHKTRSVTLGSPLLRFGMGRRFELRVGGDGGRFFQSNDVEAHTGIAGLTDLIIGAKIAVRYEGRHLPAISIMPTLSLPMGIRAFSSSAYDPGLALAWTKNLRAGLSVAGTLGEAIVSEDGVKRFQHSSAWTLGFPLPAQLNGYGEMCTISSIEPGKNMSWVTDGGISRFLGKNLQVDMEAGRSFMGPVQSWYVSAGFAWRFSRE